jgi:hypothetical protein
VESLPEVRVGRWRVEKHDGRLVVDAVLVAPSRVPMDERLAVLVHAPSLADVRFSD